MKNKVYLYFHCRQCEEENRPRAVSMNDFARLSCGWTEKGVQVWCNRHDCNVVALDFLGQKVDYESEG